MADYKIARDNLVIRNKDNASIPNEPGNADWQAYMAWVAAGGVPDPYVEPPENIARKQREAAFNADTVRMDLLDRLRTATPTQINTYVDNQVTDLASARTMFKRILLVLSQI